MQEQKRKQRKARVDRGSCVACGCCVKVCPMGAVAVKRGLYAIVNEEKCVGCGRCAKECPASIITMEEVLG